jgi:hypothetical protein
MTDDDAPVTGSTDSVCPWCSAPLPSSDEVSCRSCGATLTADVEPQLPGVTAVDAEAIARAAQQPVRQPRNRLLSWISGEYDAGTGSPADAEALAPPDDAVRREILRLELEAEVANLQAENVALMTEARLDGSGPRTGGETVDRTAPAEAATAGPLEEPDAREAESSGGNVR